MIQMLRLLILPLMFLFTGCSTSMDDYYSDNLYRPEAGSAETEEQNDDERMRAFYDELGLEDVVGYEAFRNAVDGFQKIDRKEKNILTVIDFSKPSDLERMCVIDLINKEVLFTTYVAHGRNSGEKYATSFSNVNGSYKSSLGFFVTENTYQGRNGYSLVIDGLEEGINDNAKRRAIVVHGSDYANDRVIARTGKLGRSLGCPALPRAVTADNK